MWEGKPSTFTPSPGFLGVNGHLPSALRPQVHPHRRGRSARYVYATMGADGLPPPGYAESYESNICILPAAGDPYYVGGGVLGSPKRFATGMALANNTIYAPQADASVTLSGDQVGFDEFQARGFDATSRVSGDLPSNAQVIAWGKELIGFV